MILIHIHHIIVQDYSREMEELASKWVDKCLFEHPDPQRYPEYRGLGQNIALSGGSRRNVLRLIKGWHREERDYDYKRNSCKRGKICSNYTQVSDRILQVCGFRQNLYLGIQYKHLMK